MKNISSFLLSIIMLSLSSCSSKESNNSNEPTNSNTKYNWIVYITTHYERLTNLSNYTVKQGNSIDTQPSDSLTFDFKSYDQLYFNESSSNIDKTIINYFLQYKINEPVNVKDTLVYYVPFHSNIKYYWSRIRTYIKVSSTSNDPQFHWNFTVTTTWNTIPLQDGQYYGYPRVGTIKNASEVWTGTLEFKLLTEAEANAKIAFLSVPDVISNIISYGNNLTVIKSVKVTKEIYNPLH